MERVAGEPNITLITNPEELAAIQVEYNEANWWYIKNLDKPVSPRMEELKNMLLAYHREFWTA